MSYYNTPHIYFNIVKISGNYYEIDATGIDVLSVVHIVTETWGHFAKTFRTILSKVNIVMKSLKGAYRFTVK